MRRTSEFANESEVTERDAPLLESPTGRQDQGGVSEAGPSTAGEIARHPPGGRPRSDVTSRHDSGSGANETLDGLTASEEELRKGAEEIPLGAPENAIEDIPVFDRADLLPKV
jgi:hypothetical protein